MVQVLQKAVAGCIHFILCPPVLNYVIHAFVSTKIEIYGEDISPALLASADLHFGSANPQISDHDAGAGRPLRNDLLFPAKQFPRLEKILSNIRLTLPRLKFAYEPDIAALPKAKPATLQWLNEECSRKRS